MKTFEQLTIKQVKKEIIAWETEMGREPKSVEVLSIGQHPTALDIDANIYTDGDGDTMEYFSARVIIDGEERIRYYVWDCDDEDIYTGVDEDPQDGKEWGRLKNAEKNLAAKEKLARDLMKERLALTAEQINGFINRLRPGDHDFLMEKLQRLIDINMAEPRDDVQHWACECLNTFFEKELSPGIEDAETVEKVDQENPQGPAAMILALMENNFLLTRDQSLCLISNIPSDKLEDFYNDLNKLYSVLCESSESERNFKLKAFISVNQLALKFKASYIKKMMREMFNIPQPKVEELSSRIPDKDVDLLIRHMNMWKKNIIEPGCLRDEDIPEYIYERICRFLEGERPIVRLAKGKIVKISEDEYRYEEQKP